MPVVYVFTQTEMSKRADIAEKIGCINKKGIKVLESKTINGVYDLVPPVLRLQYPDYTTASKIEMKDDLELRELKTLLEKMGVANPLIIIQYEEVIPLSSIGHGSRCIG